MDDWNNRNSRMSDRDMNDCQCSACEESDVRESAADLKEDIWSSYMNVSSGKQNKN